MSTASHAYVAVWENLATMVSHDELDDIARDHDTESSPGQGGGEEEEAEDTASTVMARVQNVLKQMKGGHPAFCVLIISCIAKLLRVLSPIPSLSSMRQNGYTTED